MTIQTDALRRVLQTLEAALQRYEVAEPAGVDQEIFRHAIVKGYELAQETSYKLLRRALGEFGYGARKLDETPAREVLRLAATHGLMTLEEVERWFLYRANRNNTAHEYGEGFARDTLGLLPGFIVDSRHLEARLRERLGS